MPWILQNGRSSACASSPVSVENTFSRGPSPAIDCEPHTGIKHSCVSTDTCQQVEGARESAELQSSHWKQALSSSDTHSSMTCRHWNPEVKLTPIEEVGVPKLRMPLQK